MTKLYDLFMAPLENRWLAEKRAQLIPLAKGDVLEIGFGTGANLKFYDPHAAVSLTALDPDGPSTLQKDSGAFRLHRIGGHAEALPFQDGTFDTVVETLVLCSVSDLNAALSEIHRVLKPGGQLIFMDHVLPEKASWAALFRGLNHVWPHIAGGCSLTRSPHLLIESHGFTLLSSGHFAHSIFRYGVAQKAGQALLKGNADAT